MCFAAADVYSGTAAVNAAVEQRSRDLAETSRSDPECNKGRGVHSNNAGLKLIDFVFGSG